MVRKIGGSIAFDRPVDVFQVPNPRHLDRRPDRRSFAPQPDSLARDVGNNDFQVFGVAGADEDLHAVAACGAHIIDRRRGRYEISNRNSPRQYKLEEAVVLTDRHGAADAVDLNVGGLPVFVENGVLVLQYSSLSAVRWHWKLYCVFEVSWVPQISKPASPRCCTWCLLELLAFDRQKSTMPRPCALPNPKPFSGEENAEPAADKVVLIA